MQTELETWQVILFLVFAAIVFLAIGSLLVVAIVDSVRQSRLRHPSRFRRVSQLEQFNDNTLEAVATTLGLKRVENVPHQIRSAVKLTLGTDLLVNGLLCQVTIGTFVLCNVRNVKRRSRTHQDGSVPTKWVEIEEFTTLVFHAAPDISFPSFNLQPNPKSLLLNVFNKRHFGHLRIEEDSEFHEKVLVGTLEPDTVVRILTPTVRDVLKANSDLTTVATDRLIVVYDRGNAGRRFRSVSHGGEYIDCEIIAPEDWPRFYQAAGSVIRAIWTAQRQTLLEQ